MLFSLQLHVGTKKESGAYILFETELNESFPVPNQVGKSSPNVTDLFQMVPNS